MHRKEVGVDRHIRRRCRRGTSGLVVMSVVLGLFVAACGSSLSGGQDQEMKTDLNQAIDTYYKAVVREDWDYTYNHLDSETRQRFTKTEWIRKNQYFENIDPVTGAKTHIASKPSLSSPVEVRLTLTLRSGTVTRTTYFVWENGQWKHRFSPEEFDHFMADASYDEFVKAH
jgi:hypothetical protein